MPVAKMTPLKDIKAVQNWSLQFAMMAAFLSAIGLYTPLINMVNLLAEGLRKCQSTFPKVQKLFCLNRPSKYSKGKLL